MKYAEKYIIQPIVKCFNLNDNIINIFFPIDNLMIHMNVN